MANFCPGCGTQIQGGGKFCIGCGQALPQAQESPGQIVQQPEQPFVQPVQQPYAPPVQQPYQPYPQQPQQPYPPQQPYAPTPEAPPKKKGKGLVILLGVLGGLAALIALIVVLASALTGRAAKKDYYELGRDRVPSVKLVLGETRKITSTSASTSNGIVTQVYQYKVASAQAEEMNAYALHLLNEDDFYLLEDENPDAFATLGRNSADEGLCLIVEILCDTAGYTVIVVKEPGQITPSDPGDDDDPYDDPYDEPAPSLAAGEVGVWRCEDDEDTTILYLRANGTCKAEIFYKENSGDDYVLDGNYVIEDGELHMYNLESDGDPYDDITLDCEVGRDELLLGGYVYERIG